MSFASPTPVCIPDIDGPRAPPVQYDTPLGTRWQKEKEAAGGEQAFQYPDDPKYIGPWVLGECVGKGASGRVKLARHRRTGQIAAVKILPLEPSFSSRASLRTRDEKSEKFRLGLDREIITMKLMRHPNIMRIFDVYEGDHELYLVLEYVEGGELFDFLVNRGRMPPERALMYFKQIIAGLNYAHTFSIVHRDLKPENILIQSLDPPSVKIADWGMAAFNPPSLQLGTSCGSPHYASPEIVKGEQYSGPMSDIWSCGVILYALLTGRLPFDDKDIRKLLAKVRSGQFELSDWIDPQAGDLISRMLVVDVSKRITMAEILQHPWMQNHTPGVHFHPSPSVTELARPFSTSFLDEEVMESLHVICGRHMSIEQLVAELCSPAGDGNYVKAFYYLLDQHRRLTLEENGIHLDVYLDDPSARRVSKQYTRPVSRTNSRTSSALAPSPLVPSLGLSPPMRAHSTSATRSRAPSPAGPRHPPVRRATSPDTGRLRPPHSPGRDMPPHLRPSGLPTPSRNSQRSRTIPSPQATPNSRNARCRSHSPMFMDSPQAESGQFSSPPSPTPYGTGDRGVLRPVALPANAPAHPMFTAPVVQDPMLQSSIDAIARRMNVMVSEQDRTERSRYATECGAPYGHVSDTLPRRRAETANVEVRQRGNKENQAGMSRGYDKFGPQADSKENKYGELKRKSRPAPLELYEPKARTTSGGSQMSPMLSPAVELKGWFSNLFKWGQTHHLRSRENVARTRDEITHLLSLLGVGLVGEDIGGRLVLRCVVEDGARLGTAGDYGVDSARGIKGMTFRVEIHAAPSDMTSASAFLPLAPTAYGNGSAKRALRNVPIAPNAGECVVVLIQEKGALSTFRMVFNRLKDLWTFDVASSAGSAPGSGWPSRAVQQDYAKPHFVY